MPLSQYKELEGYHDAMKCHKTGSSGLLERLTSFLKVYACTTRFR